MNDSSIEIQTVNGEVAFEIQPPGSKSITNRALVCAALADGQSVLHGVLTSDDSRVMIEGLRKLGVAIKHRDKKREKGQGTTVVVDGVAGSLNDHAEIFVDNSGTTIRFLTGVLGVHGGEFRLHGSPRMHERPIGPLVDALNLIGSQVAAESDGGCPPVNITGKRVTHGQATIAGNVSSQYLSGLMLASPMAEEFSIKLIGELVSQPYVTMTQEVMRSFGVDSELDLDATPNRFSVHPNSQYRACEYSIEPDASAASYFWAAAAICGGRATVLGLNRNSLQGDVRFVDCLKAMGCELIEGDNQITVVGPAKHGIDVNMEDISDTVQTLATVALFVEGETRVRGVAHNRVKETDRIGNLAIELRKLGAEVIEHEDGMTIVPGVTRPATIETYKDHRMAMSLTLAGLRQEGVVINDPSCTAKTYPNFFADLNRVLNDKGASDA